MFFSNDAQVRNILNILSLLAYSLFEVAFV